MPTKLGDMKDPDSPRDRFIPGNARTAEFLTDQTNHALLAHFWGSENTVAVVARALGWKPNAALYRVKSLLEMGILEVSRVEKRRGRAITYYRVVADEFYVPFAVTSFETEAAFVKAQLEPLFERLIEAEARRNVGRQQEGGLLIHKNAQDNIMTERVLRSRLEGDSLVTIKPTDSIRTWGTGQISNQRAQTIVKQFYELLTDLRLIDDDGPNSRLYLFQMTMLPLEDESGVEGGG